MRALTAFLLAICIFWGLKACSSARAGILQDTAVRIASRATGMPSTTWRLDVTNDMPADAQGYWDQDTDPRAVRVRPLSEMDNDWTLWCMFIVHEAWHVKNQNGEHSSDPNNILYSVLYSPTDYIYPPCERAPDAQAAKTTPAVRRIRRPDRWPGHARREVLR